MGGENDYGENCFNRKITRNVPLESPNNPESTGIDLKIVRDNAFNAAQKALTTDKYWLETLRMMMLKNYTDPITGKPKDPDENDFECFENDKGFRSLLKLID